jgi:hypothetical protein
MRFWSEGLGKQQLVLGLDRSIVVRKSDKVQLTGVVDEPAPWEYEVTMTVEDWNTILRMAFSPDACDFIAKKVSVPLLIGMAWSIAKFIIGMSIYRTLRILRLSRDLPLKEESAVDSKAAKKDALKAAIAANIAAKRGV